MSAVLKGRMPTASGTNRVNSPGAAAALPSKARERRKQLSRPWDAGSLRDLLASTLRGDQIIVASSREPHAHQRLGAGVRVTQPASGLVTAVEPVVSACAGTWIAHGSGDADFDFVDANDVWHAPAKGGPYRLRRLRLAEDEQAGHGDGFSNSGLWPLCHMAHVRPSFSAADWEHYRRVNQRFAEAIVSEATRPDPIVMVHDYQLALVPLLVRRLLPRATIVSFWHIPWAHSEQMGICPWLPELVEGMLGSDIVGFQTPRHVRNFVDSAAGIGGNGVCASGDDIVRGGHRSRVRHYPISIAWPTVAETKESPSIAQCRREAEARWSIPTEAKLIVGVDRLDYTKGLIERMRAIEQLLVSHPRWQGRLRFVQVAAPTRSALHDYALLRAQLIAEAKRINARFRSDGPAPILLLDEQHDRASVNVLYRAAQVCLVTSLHDGMNLVCKEFVASRDDEQGVLVLSQFAGASHELCASLVVNPYHVAQVADAVHCALSMSAQEQRRRMRSLRETVRSQNVHRWAARMLLDAACLRGARSRGDTRRNANAAAAAAS